MRYKTLSIKNNLQNLYTLLALVLSYFLFLKYLKLGLKTILNVMLILSRKKISFKKFCS
jgi:hypothetical protein